MARDDGALLRKALLGHTIDNKARQNDIDWGIGLPLYGLYRYGRYTGDWGRVRRHWPACKRLANYFNLGDDWAWMTVVNAEDGYGAGTGDALNAAYAGMVAMREMARVLGDRPAEELYAYRAARMALLTALRPAYSVWGRANGFITRGEVALGFWERMQLTTSSYRGDPWGPSTLLSGSDYIPEILALYEWSQPHQWRNWLTEYATSTRSVGRRPPIRGRGDVQRELRLRELPPGLRAGVVRDVAGQPSRLDRPLPGEHQQRLGRAERHRRGHHPDCADGADQLGSGDVRRDLHGVLSDSGDDVRHPVHAAGRVPTAGGLGERGRRVRPRHDAQHAVRPPPGREGAGREKPHRRGVQVGAIDGEDSESC